MLQFLKKWWPTITPIAVAAFTAAVPSIQQALAAHPTASAAVAALYAALAHIQKSPLASTK